MRLSLVCLAALAGAAPASAGLFDSFEAQAALGEELRELFHDEPDLVAPAVAPPAALNSAIASELYAEEIAEDLGRIGREAPALFDRDRPAIGDAEAEVAMVLLTGEDCPGCAAAKAELDTLAKRLGLRVNVVDVSDDAADRAAMERLTLDMLPSYVMRDKMIRGAMPAVVLERYLTD